MCIVHYTVYFVHCIVCVRRTCRRDDGRYRPGTQVDRVRGHGSMRMLIDSRGVLTQKWGGGEIGVTLPHTPLKIVLP